MATTHKTVEDYLDELELINTWDELKKFESFARIKQALRADSKNRAYRKTYQQDKNALLRKARAMLAAGELTL